MLQVGSSKHCQLIGVIDQFIFPRKERFVARPKRQGYIDLRRNTNFGVLLHLMGKQQKREIQFLNSLIYFVIFELDA